jgi:hypothetical protein
MAPSPLPTKNTHPRRDFTSITQIGLKAFGLAGAYQSVIEPRVPPGTILGLLEDLEALDVVVPGAALARVDAKSATETQNATLEKAQKRIQAIRTTVHHAGAPKEVQHAYGVGSATGKLGVTKVKAAVKQIRDRLTAHPEEAAAYGIQKQDVDALTTVDAEVSATNKTQEKKHAEAPLTTKERNRVANRILLAAKRIKGAGLAAFAESPTERAEFAAIKIAAPRKKSGKAKAKAKPGGATAKPTQPAQPTQSAQPAAATEPAAPVQPAVQPDA